MNINGVLASETGYDALARPTWTNKFGALQRTLDYNADGTLRSVADARDGVGFDTKVRLSSWKLGIPQRIDYPGTPDQPGGSYQTAVVSVDGLIQSMTDENQFQTCYQYDVMGRLIRVDPPSNTGGCDAAQSNWNKTALSLEKSPVAAYGLPVGHWRHVVTTGAGEKIVHFDALLRPVVEEAYDSGLKSTTKSVVVKRYDSSGRLSFQSYPLRDLAHHANATLGVRTEYDDLDRVTAVREDADGGLVSTTTQYLSGFKTRVTSPRGQTTGASTTTSYMAFDDPNEAWPTLVEQPEGVTTHLYRDAFGKLLHMVRTDFNTLWDGRYYVYDAHQRLCREEALQEGASARGYDAAGNVAWSAGGLPGTVAETGCVHTAQSVATVRVDRTYDQRNRIKTLTFPQHSTGAGNGNQSWTYTPDGLPSQIRTQNVPASGADPKETINVYLYNTRRLLTDESVTIVGPSWSVLPLHYGYDRNGQLASHTYPTGHQVAYSPDGLGRPTQVVSPSAAVTYASNIIHHPNGATASLSYGNGVAFKMVQNARQLPARVTHGPFGASAINPALILDNNYWYDANGNVITIEDLKRGNAGHRWMGYDNLDRINYAGSATFGLDHHLHFTYDIFDNIRSWKTPTAVRRDDYCYDARNRLAFLRINNPSCAGGSARVAFGYDDRGNVSYKNGQTFQFDLGNRLREVSSSTSAERYRYDGHGRRVLASRINGPEPSLGTLLSQYSQSGQLMYQSNFRAEAAKDTEYIYLNGTLLAQREVPQSGAPAAVKYQHTDALGTPAAITNSVGSLIERMDYNPYGGTTAGTLKDAPGFTGHPLDRATGMNYMQQRYYDPEIGRFLSVDPVTADPNTGGNFNRYWYANNNPYKFTDPDGRLGRCMGGSIACHGGVTTYQVSTSLRSPNDSDQSGYSKPDASSSSQRQSTANSIASKVTERGRFLPGLKGRAEANAIVRNNSDPSTFVRVNAADLTVTVTGRWTADQKGGERAGATVQGSDFFVHGSITIRARPNGTFGIYDAPYDFEMKNGLSPVTISRNILTAIGNPGSGTPFMIRYQGDTNCTNCEE